jgi:hypothetical protein
MASGGIYILSFIKSVEAFKVVSGGRYRDRKMIS